MARSGVGNCAPSVDHEELVVQVPLSQRIFHAGVVLHDLLHVQDAHKPYLGCVMRRIGHAHVARRAS
eukprot:9412046-Pyramimonas_sp.AAC.2